LTFQTDLALWENRATLSFKGEFALVKVPVPVCPALPFGFASYRLGKAEGGGTSAKACSDSSQGNATVQLPSSLGVGQSSTHAAAV
jgi:hypothetical protein